MSPRAPRVVIIDYQMSNLFSVQHACEFVGLDATLSSDPRELLNADAAILPGVGAFGDAMRNLDTLGLTDAIRSFVKSGKPLMGVCLGLQLLFSESDEFGAHKGLDVVQGTVTKFPATGPSGNAIKIPQIGWNQIFRPNDSARWDASPLRDVANGAFMYFVHSFIVKPKDPDVILSKTVYDSIEYCSSVMYNNVVAFQFHPEKSGPEGIKIYQHWARAITS